MCRVAGTAVLVIVLAASHSTAAIGGDGSSPDSAGEALGIVNVVLVPAVPRGPDKRAVREAVSFVRHTRAVMRPRLPLQLFADSVTRRRLDSPSPQWTFGCANASRLWDYHADAHTLHSALQPLVQRAQRGQGEGQGPPGASPRDFFWLSKFNAMLSARFERSLYMDTDVYVLQPVFAHALLTHGLGVHDVAAVIDPGRAYAPGSTRRTHSGGFWDTDYAGPPPFCGCMLAFRRTAEVHRWMVLAAGRYLRQDFPQRSSQRSLPMRKTDQEALWMEYTSNPSLRLRLSTMPEEYFCPFSKAHNDNERAPWQPASRQREHDDAHFDPFALTWTTSWGVPYPCRAVHTHSALLREMLLSASGLAGDGRRQDDSISSSPDCRR